MYCLNSDINDGLVKSLKVRFFVIPAQAGIQCFQVVRIIWIPVFTGMTTFYDSIINEISEKVQKSLITSIMN